MTNEELWQLFPILLEPHNPAWAQRYQQEQSLLLQALDGTAVRLLHIGSTAVPGLLAKPTIDMLLEVGEQTDLDQLREVLQGLGYLYDPQPDKPPPHMMFLKGYTPRGFRGQVFHLHVRYPGDQDELRFRDYLRAHPQTAAAYGALKQRLREQYAHDRDGYTAAKTEFVRRVTALSRACGEENERENNGN